MKPSGPLSERKVHYREVRAPAYAKGKDNLGMSRIITSRVIMREVCFLARVIWYNGGEPVNGIRYATQICTWPSYVEIPVSMQFSPAT